MWVAVAVWAAVIFGFSSLPGSAIPGHFSVPGHVVVYAVLGALLLLALGRPSPAFIAAAVTLASAYGVSDEFHQSFVPGRCPDPADWAVDTAAALLGALVVAALLVARHRREGARRDGAEAA